MLWDNDLTKIRRENVERIGNMNGTMWDQLAPIVQYLSSFSIPLFEQEVIKKDLIGFAEEADIENITLEQKLGMPPKGFCDFLLQDKDRSRSRWIGENLLGMITDFTCWLTLFGIFNIVTGEEILDGVDLWLAILFAISSNLFDGNIVLYKGRQAFDKKKWKIQIIIKSVAIVILAVFLSRYKVVIPLDENRWIIVGCFVLVSLLFVGIRNWYWNHQSKKYDWKS